MALIYLFSNKYLHVHLNANRNRVGGVVQVLLNEIQAGLYDFLFSFLLRLNNLNIIKTDFFKSFKFYEQFGSLRAFS